MTSRELSQLLFSFNGRICRKVYIITSIVFPLIIGAIFGFLYPVIAHFTDPKSPIILLILLPMYFICGWVGFALTVKRLHDIDKSGYWFFITFIPVVGGVLLWILTWFIKGTFGSNQYGDDPLMPS